MLVKTPAKPKKRAKPNRKVSPKRKRTSKRTNGKSSTRYGKKAKKTRKRLSLPPVQPWKIILCVLVAGALGILYLTHVFATQQLLAEVQQLEQQYEQVKRTHDRYRLTHDRMIGPKEIYGKAKAAGFIDGGPAEKVIEVKPVE